MFANVTNAQSKYQSKIDSSLVGTKVVDESVVLHASL